MTTLRRNAIIRSTLWAAYGDALGFITELANSSSTVKSRSGHDVIDSLVPWKRRLGGFNGVPVRMLSGTYSDDTQLRLASSRAINGSGFFDVEAFAKFELPTWLCYALGAGRGTKVATFSLTQKNKNWFSNFYSQKGIEYVNGGGNGAAMRIQPHVWSASHLDNPSSFMIDVVRNSIVTHGHPRGIAGAVFHAVILSTSLLNQRLSISDLEHAADYCRNIPLLFSNDELISNVWVPEWEEQSGIGVFEAFEKVSKEIHDLVKLSDSWISNPDLCYEDLVSLLSLSDESVRGAGTNTSVAAALLCLKVDDSNVSNIILNIVNRLGTDTDTIGTMFGAIAGCIIKQYPPEPVQDQDYLIKESTRLYYLSQGMKVDSFSYPDLKNWNPIKSAVNYVMSDDQGLFISGFGYLNPISKEFLSKSDDFLYQWVSTSLGFSLLVKRKLDELIKNKSDADTAIEKDVHEIRKVDSIASECSQIDWLISGDHTESKDDSPVERDIDSLFGEVIANNFSPQIIGSHILLLSQKESFPIESVIAYSSMVAKAKRNRDKKHK